MNFSFHLLLFVFCTLSCQIFAHSCPLPKPYDGSLNFPSRWSIQYPSSPLILKASAPSYATISPNLVISKQSHTPLTPLFFKNLKATFQDTGLYRYKELGFLSTEMGKLPLIQIEGETPIAEVVLLQTFIPFNNELFSLTATATKEEFPKYYAIFLHCFSSFKLK